jgi:hypothetical protein
MDLMMMVVEMTLILLVEVAVVSHGSLEVRSTLNKQHQYRIQIQVGILKQAERCVENAVLI